MGGFIKKNVGILAKKKMGELEHAIFPVSDTSGGPKCYLFRSICHPEIHI